MTQEERLSHFIGALETMRDISELDCSDAGFRQRQKDFVDAVLEIGGDDPKGGDEVA